MRALRINDREFGTDFGTTLVNDDKFPSSDNDEALDGWRLGQYSEEVRSNLFLL